MDKETRNRIQRATQQARTLLEEDYERQLDGTYDIPKDGRVAELPGAHLEPWQVPIREKLVAAVEHRRAGGLKPAEAVAAYLREAAFTTLNRFVALKMLEARGLVQEALSKGEQSSGFKEYGGLAPGLMGLPDHGYRLYLESLFDEIGQEVKVLFDRSEPASLLWPSHQVFQALLGILNQADLAEVWQEDETIGWVYQYFNSDKDRQEARYDDKGKPKAPQNSRELAVRNQFFTPRYVVEFLTDNTLGRTWYEMRQGETSLVDRCQYLVRRRRPVFMAPGEAGPEPFVPAAASPLPGSDEAAMWTRPNPELEEPLDIHHYAQTMHGHLWARDVLGRDDSELFEEKAKTWQDAGKWEGTFEELRCCLFYLTRSEIRHGAHDPKEWDLEQIRPLYQEICRRWDLETEHIPFRAKKDPRDLKILDPACGSGHFLLYCFDLLLPIYEEAWADESSPRSEATGRTLRQDYATLEDLRAAIPGLVLRHNLHGIDIDPRAAQIAALALWMRAQRAFGDFALARSARPMIRRTNIVVAEPMPGEPELRQEFLATLDRPLSGLVEKVFEKMELAGEAGSLLRIEEDIRDAIRDARKKWQALPRGAQLSLEGFEPKGEQMHLQELWEVSDEGYWEQAERRVYEALERYAGGGRNAGAFRRRLFVEDATRGFAFIDLCRQRYQVILMNPPFGTPAEPTREYIEEKYPIAKSDLFACFLSWATDKMAPQGRTGAITSRLCFFLSGLEDWRRSILLGAVSSLETLADLGHNVLDDALVEAAAYTITTSRKEHLWAASMLQEQDKDSGLRRSIASDTECWKPNILEICGRLSGTPIAYWTPPFVLESVLRHSTIASECASACWGLKTDDDFRFLRLAWEVPPNQIGSTWRYYAKGGEYAPYYDDIHLAVHWHNGGRQLRAFVEQRYSWTKRAASLDKYGLPGLTYPERTTSEFSPRLLPKEVIFSNAGPGIIPVVEEDSYALLSAMYTRWFRLIIELFVGGGDAVQAGSAARHYKAGIISSLPCPRPHGESWNRLRQIGRRCAISALTDLESDETSRFFRGHEPSETCWRAQCGANLHAYEDRFVVREELSYEADMAVLDLVGATPEQVTYVREAYGPHPAEFSGDNDPRAVTELLSMDYASLSRHLTEEMGYSRQITKLSHWSDKHYEAVALAAKSSVSGVVTARRSSRLLPQSFLTPAASAQLSFLFGIAIGRWRRESMAEGPPQTIDPLAHLPQAAPALSECGGVAILVHDQGHELDVVSRISAITDSWRWHDDDLKQMIADTGSMEVSPQNWFSRIFFDHHLSRYSKSRRKAPIYWQLATPSASYSVWLYYHRLTRDTFYQVLNDFVVPKLRHEEAKLTELRQDVGPSPTSRQRQEIDNQANFVDELRAYREEVDRVAPLWNPNLNDGVIINFAPLWRLVPQHREWQKECRECWNKLAAGDYDWAHLAMHLWPERVVPKCATDRSLAIAHDLEEVFWQEGPDGKWRQKSVPPETIAALVAERTSPAVRDARDQLLQAPEPLGRRGARRAASTPRPPRAPRAPRPAAPEPQTAPTPRPRATADPQAREAILRHLSTTPAGASKSDLLAATALDESAWKPTIDDLLATGQVTRTGEKRGTRYHLAAPTRVS